MATRECGKLIDEGRYGPGWVDGTCHEPKGHSGCHVGIGRDGMRTGFHYGFDNGTDYYVTRDHLGWSQIERIPAKIYHQV